MKIQKMKLQGLTETWIVVGKDHLPIEPISEFLVYLLYTGKSTCTLRTYANHMKIYWNYLSIYKLEWATITLHNLANFVGWLQTNAPPNVISLPTASARKASSINAMLACISSFYSYHYLLGNTQVTFTENANRQGHRYKGLLHHIYKNKPTQKRIISLKPCKMLPKTITAGQYQQILNACHNPRDVFLIVLLYETGLRIGQALALRHEDIVSWDNEIHIQQREYNSNGARNKTRHPYIVSVPTKLMAYYNKYVSLLPTDLVSDYVFVDLTDYKPLRYNAINKLFLRLSNKIGLKITPHILRHTHATDLIKAGWDASFVQKRLGHSSVQTTLDVYTHLDQQTLNATYKKYISDKENYDDGV